MNKQRVTPERRPVPGTEKAKLNRLKPKTRLIVVGSILIVVLIATVSAWAQSFNVNLMGGDNAEIACDGRGMQVQRLSRTAVNIICSGPSDNPQPTQPPAPTPTSPAPEPTNPPPQPTNPPPQPTNPPPQPTSPPPQPTSPPPPPPGGNIQPFAGAPACEDIGIAHDNRAWHGIWSYEYGCHWDHEHNCMTSYWPDSSVA